MPLHIVPLCELKYVGNTVCSGAIFRYKSLNKIIKAKTRLLSIKKGENIDKVFSQRYLFLITENQINKYYSKEMNTKYKEIHLKWGVLLSNHKKLEFIIDNFRELRDGNSNIVTIKHSKELRRPISILYIKKNIMLRGKYKELIPNALSIYLKSPEKNFIVEYSMMLKSRQGDRVVINKLEILYLIKKRNNATINIYRGIYLKKITDMDFNIETGKLLTRVIKSKMNKSYFLKCIKGQTIRDLKFILNTQFLIRNNNINLGKNHGIDIVTLLNLRNMRKITLTKKVDRGVDKYINKLELLRKVHRDKNKQLNEDLSIKLIDRNNLKRVNKTDVNKNLYRIAIEKISKFLHRAFLYRTISIETLEEINNYGLVLLKRTPISKSYNTRYTYKFVNIEITFLANILGLYKDSVGKIFKVLNKYIFRNKKNKAYKIPERTVNRVPSIFTLKFDGALFLKIGYRQVNLIETKLKFIETIKRWWWLNSSNPRDNLIIPNKDFDYTQELLNNPKYEYLRFNNHPIEWGNIWGIDYNIPAYAVSIEIMLDLVNILIMVWHDNIQGWLCSTGKESMQFIIELLYDWYTLETSTPNPDYYRSYRWIRWEAEKVYFLNLDTGLQAVGVLVANLIDYLKQHHFNLVPLWRNPKAMDIERNFNRIVQNGDLMKVLDKLKGRRYYYIDTQNIEKKNIFGGD
ncbi:hypothetical protein ACMXKO_11015 [Clostridium tyrobutyricum]|uniref:hypothetical protein n=1 Tax=Clostridium tyrobutyricum TaxID=1519 RepID=UPI0039F6519E